MPASVSYQRIGYPTRRKIDRGKLTGAALAPLVFLFSVAPNVLLKFTGNSMATFKILALLLVTADSSNSGKLVLHFLGRAVRLDGVYDYLAVSSPQYNLNKYTTVIASSWVQTTSNNEQVIISYDDIHYCELSMDGATIAVVFTINTNGGKVVLTSNTPINDGQCYYVTATFTNGLLHIYQMQK